jgi:hypothetical protein
MAKTLTFFLAAAAMLMGAQGLASAQTRTWVSGVGDDLNPCSRTLPCKTYPGAISKTAVNGEVSTLDKGAFGAVTITKSMSIVAEGAAGSILNTSTSGIIINGANIEVNLRGIFIEGGPAGGLHGIRILQAKSVNIHGCMIRGQTGNADAAAIRIAPNNTTVKVTVTNCMIAKNSIGVIAAPIGTGVANVVLDNVTILNSTTYGLRVEGAGTTTVSNSVLTSNGTGFGKNASATLVSLGNNVVDGNGTQGAPTSTVPLK